MGARINVMNSLNKEQQNESSSTVRQNSIYRNTPYEYTSTAPSLSGTTTLKAQRISPAYTFTTKPVKYSSEYHSKK